MRPALLALLLLIAGSSFAADLGKYKDWLDSPEAYFITKAERKAFRDVRSESEAAAFVARYRERRGGIAFTSMIEHRTGLADRLFNTGPNGSRTLRGKLVVLFGAPSDVNVSRQVASYKPPGPSGHPMPGGDIVGGSYVSAPISHGAPAPPPMIRVVKLTFPASSNATFNGQDFAVSIDVDVNSGKDRLAKGTNRKQLQALMDAAVDASIVKP